jgi:thymidylate synthase (FAD)
MENRHGTPFEHNLICFYIEAPIFVTRQLLKHRAGVSLNEESGRYKEFEPVFYCAEARERPLAQEGKAKDYKFVAASDEQWRLMRAAVEGGLQQSWHLYQYLLSIGLSREVARMHLPLSVYSSVQMTFNTRSLMHFLSLRREHPESRYPSHPQWEMSQLSALMEEHFASTFPIVHDAYVRYGRVCP